MTVWHTSMMGVKLEGTQWIDAEYTHTERINPGRGRAYKSTTRHIDRDYFLDV